MKKDYLNIITKYIKENTYITEKELAIKLNVTERTIRRYIKHLKDNKIVRLEGNGINKRWVVFNLRE